MSYRLLVLPSYNADGRPVLHVEGNYVYTASPLAKVETMTPQLLCRIKELVEEGATVLGTRPLKSPSLAGFPGCDQELTRLADALWGKGAGSGGNGEHRLGKGRVVWGVTPEQVLAGMGLSPDFSCDPSIHGKLRYTHRRTDDGLELYFVANKVDGVTQGACGFRVAAGQPELWRPETGRTELVAQYEQQRGLTLLPLRLEPYESVFVVFRPGQASFDPAVSVTHEGRSIGPRPSTPAKIVVKKAVYSAAAGSAATRDVTAKVQAIVDRGERRFAAWRLSEGDDPGVQALKTLSIDYTLDGRPSKTVVLDGETACLDDALDPLPTARTQRTADGRFLLEAWQNGRYELRTASGRTLRSRAKGVPGVEPIEGPWEVCFPKWCDAPRRNSEREASRKNGPRRSSEHPIPTIDLLAPPSRPGREVLFRHGDVPKDVSRAAGSVGADRELYLDLGKVAVIAEVRVNGKDLGILWKAPFRVDASGVLRAGDNRLEVRVTNLWVNRLIGDEQLPEDSDRDPNGLLKSWPAWLLQNKPSPAGRQTFATYRVWKKDSPLQESGLLGPVRLYGAQRIVIQ